MRRLLVLGTALALFAPAASGAQRPVVLIAVVDSGITPTKQVHPEFLVPGYNALDGSARTADEFGHGDEVAGALLQELSIGVYTTGICAECRVVPVKIAGESGVAPSAAMAAGLRWAADHGARVINLSYGPVPFAPQNETVEAAIRYALDHGAVVVLSAGNAASADPAVDKYASGVPDTLTVAAAVATDALEPHSNHGAWVDLAAIASSTSLAAPHVAGAAAEVISWRPELSRADVVGYLRQGCFPAPALDVAWHCLSTSLDAVKAAGFDPAAWRAVHVSGGGDGRGTISSADGSIACNGACHERLQIGARMTLTATPAAGSAFGGWSGACAGRQPTCTLTLDSSVDVTALFTVRRAALSIRRIGPGAVTSSPAGIRCGTDCNGLFKLGPVRLVARPAAGGRFVRWEGACRGTRPACTVTLRAERTVTARFTKRT